MKNKTSKELRTLIILAKRKIDEWTDFIISCEKEIKKNRNNK